MRNISLLSPRARRTADSPGQSQNMLKCTTAMVSVLLGDFPPRGELQIAWTRGLSGSTQVLRSSIHAECCGPCGSHSNIRTCSPIERFAEHPNSFRVSHLPSRENAGHLVGRPAASCAAPSAASVRHTYRAPACLSPYRRHRAGRNYALGGSIVQCMADFAPRHRPNRLCK